jgi:hypothetical protein
LIPFTCRLYDDEGVFKSKIKQNLVFIKWLARKTKIRLNNIISQRFRGAETRDSAERTAELLSTLRT